MMPGQQQRFMVPVEARQHYYIKGIRFLLSFSPNIVRLHLDKAALLLHSHIMDRPSLIFRRPGT